MTEPGVSAAGDAPIRRILDAARAKSRDVASSLHPDWVRRGLQRLGLGAIAAEDLPAAWSAPLVALYDLQWPALDRFGRPAHRMALLPRADLRRVLGAVAVHGERQRVRLCIGQGVRALLLERVGQPAYERMLEAPPLKSASTSAFTAADLDADRLATAGLDRLVADGHWQDAHLLDWARLAIAPGAERAACRGDAGAAARTQDLLTRLPSYFPEHAWLFGSIMDRALSVSTTA